jgi:sulfur carrier protein
MPHLFVNGTQTPHRDGESVSALLARVGMPPEQRGLAVAVNDEVLPRGEWPERALAPGDRVEILQAVQGG